MKIFSQTRALHGVVGALGLVMAAAPVWAQNAPTRTPGLTIVVIAGEDAVNVIQQKTATAPVVEVRDRNDQPVAGAVVKFAIQGGRATFNGAKTLTLTTDVTGRAAATSLTPTSSGAVHITATASLHGQVATASIVQTNVATTAAASAAGGSGAAAAGTSAAGSAATGGAVAGGAVAGGAAAGGGGLSALTIGAIAAGAGGGGLIVAKAVTGNSAAAAPSTGPFTGPYSAQRPATRFPTLNGAPNGECTSTRALDGTLTMTLDQQADGTVSGTLHVVGVDAMVSTTCPTPDQPLSSNVDFEGPVTGAVGNLQFISVAPGSKTIAGLGLIAITNTWTFSGTLTKGVVAGTMTMRHEETLVQPADPSVGFSADGSVTFPVTLK